MLSDCEWQGEEHSSKSDEEHPTIRDKLREWAVNSGTPQCHIQSLFGILGPHFPCLPKDAWTQLNTPRAMNVQKLAGAWC